MNTRTRLLTLLACLLATAASAAAKPAAPAKTAASAANVVTLLTRDLPEIPGKEVVMLTVAYLPGGSSMPHRHDAEVFVYVLEGSVVMQVDGQPAQTLHAGQTFHESPTDVHRQSANGSATEPAKLLVFVIKDKNKPLTVPVTGTH
jgi:quercetin dioxygenase-like cupin family protein